MKKRQANNKEGPSRVLLVCVYDTIVLEITNEVVYSRFSPHGHILKILIFERGEVTKFFIEFSDVPSAEKVTSPALRPNLASMEPSSMIPSAK